MNFKTAFALLIFTAPPLAAEPIQWREWTDDVFAQAKREDKLVLLDLEAVWCHWCHVMDEQTYNDIDVRNLINSNYVPVRVDQDSRPDLSNRYEDYGWPATIVFDAKGRELAKRAGYIPSAPMREMLKAFINDPTPGPSVRAAENVTMGDQTSLPAKFRKPLEKDFFDTYDPKFFGWGTVHKFLDPDLMEYALGLAASGNEPAASMARQTLIANLALIDPVWGGVYQYSTGGKWTEPHFEKIMFYQAGDLRTYALAYALWRNSVDLKAAQDIHRYLTSFLLSASGAFYTSQDADVVKGEHSDVYFQKSDKDRRKIGMPAIDKHRYARENGWAIESLAMLYAVSGDKSALEQAKRAAGWIEKNRSLPGGGFRHDEEEVAGPYLADTLAMARAFLGLYAVTAERSWLDKASFAANFIIANFQNADGGFVTAKTATAGLAPTLQRDENASAARFLNLLNHYTGIEAYRKMAEHAMRYLTSPAVIGRQPTATILLVDNELSAEPAHITVVGSKKNPLTHDLFSVALSDYPLTYRRIELWDRADGPLPNNDIQYPELDQPAAFVCAEGRCSLPLLSVEKLKAKLHVR
jgi:uncharacterized protein YyaL (SSP411 family)